VLNFNGIYFKTLINLLGHHINNHVILELKEKISICPQYQGFIAMEKDQHLVTVAKGPDRTC